MKGLKLFSSFVLLSGSFWLVGCSSSTERTEPTNLFQTIEYNKTPPWAKEVRMGGVYQNFQLKLEVFGIFYSPTFKNSLVEANPGFQPGAVPQNWLEPDATTAEGLDFIITVFWPGHGSYSVEELTRNWQITLKVDDAELVPLRFQKLTDKDYEYRYLADRFQQVNRWTNVYKLHFAKPLNLALSPSALSPSAPKAMSISFVGLPGSTVLKWQPLNGLFSEQTLQPARAY